MRGIPFSIFILILLIFISIEILAFWGLFQRIRHATKSTRFSFLVLYWIVSIFILGSLSYVFSSPSRLKNISDYSYFNFILLLVFFNLIPKLMLGLFAVFSWLVGIWRRKASEVFYFSGLILTLGILALMIFSIFIDKKQVRTEKIEISLKQLPEQLDGLTIVQLSDIHLGSMSGEKAIIRQTVKRVNALQPDLILFTGDMVNNFGFETKGFVSEFSKMKARFGKFAITGNHDYGDYFRWQSQEERNANLHSIRDSIAKMGFKLLLNENHKLQVADTSIYIVGVENWGHDPFPQYADLESAMEDIPQSAFSILMSHDPAHWESQVLSQTNIPLTLSGHTHGLQFGVRIAGIEFSPMFFIQKYWAGLFRIDNRYLYVNRGLGTVGFPGRVGMRPEISFLKLQRSKVKHAD